MENVSKRKVFISYARRDAPDLQEIISKLRTRGLLEKNDEILGQTDFHQKHQELRGTVRRQMESASKVVVIWGSASAQSQWVNYEIGLADALGKPIIAVVTNAKGAMLPSVLGNVQVIKLGDDG